MISKYLGIDSDYIIIGLCGGLLILFILVIINIYERKRCEDIGRYIDSKARSG